MPFESESFLLKNIVESTKKNSPLKMIQYKQKISENEGPFGMIIPEWRRCVIRDIRLSVGVEEICEDDSGGDKS